MKKISVLMALIICVTIGSVYAAWSYTGTTVSSVDRTISHGMTTATTDGDVGVMSIVSNSVDVAIDQTAIGNYLAKLVITGSITVKFTPNPGAPENVVNGAIDAIANVYIQNAAENKYNDAEIYVATENVVELEWEKQTDGTFLATVTADQIDTLLDLGADFVLDTYAKYQAFHALEEKLTLTVIFSQQ